MIALKEAPMPSMPNPNAPECDCRTLERLSKEPTAPIEFDATMNEYHIVGTNGFQSMIYHCPFCGGRTPESRRDDFFMHITHAEMKRLNMLTGHLKTLEEVLAAFGPPDYDNPTGTGVTKDDETGRPVTKYYRTLTYTGLSSAANVNVEVHVDDRVQFSFMPKEKTGL
jgi:hypothetical protein